MDTLHIIRNYLNTNHDISPEAINPDTKLDDIGIDSISFLELVFEFESKFGINAPDNEVDSIKTIGELISLIEKYMPENNGAVGAPQ